MKSKIALAILCSALVGLIPVFSQTTHSVTLNWSASPTTGVKYNVYRNTAATGTYAKIASDVGALTYTDSSGTGGTSYYYQVTAVCDTTTTCPAGISGESAPLSGGPFLFLGNPAAPAGVLTGTSN